MADVFLCWFTLRRNTGERRHRDKGYEWKEIVRDGDMKKIIPL
jgi:hypothetical protein